MVQGNSGNSSETHLFLESLEIKKTHSLQFTKTINNGICPNENDDRLTERKKNVKSQRDRMNGWKRFESPRNISAILVGEASWIS